MGPSVKRTYPAGATQSNNYLKPGVILLLITLPEAQTHNSHAHAAVRNQPGSSFQVSAHLTHPRSETEKSNWVHMPPHIPAKNGQITNQMYREKGYTTPQILLSISRPCLNKYTRFPENRPGSIDIWRNHRVQDEGLHTL